MWICAACGTQAQQPDMCTGCGSPMRPFDQPPKEERYKFVLIAHAPKGGLDVFGPFPTVLAADQWWEHCGKEGHVYNYKDYEVVLMENPNDRAS